VSWRLAFTDLDQALMKSQPRPAGWEHTAAYVRIDLGRDYQGAAGFVVEVNGEPLGSISNVAPTPPYLELSTDRWVVPVPRDVLARDTLTRVVLRPSQLDARLTVAGHGDPLVEPLGPGNSWFFDGRAWHNDQLAGPAAGRAVGTYRIWLEVATGIPA
jgi:hypothetical protein